MVSLNSVQIEVDASFLYHILGQHESDSNVAAVFHQMSEIEHAHALTFLKRSNLTSLPHPSRRAKTLNKIGSLIGYDYILGTLLDTEKKLSLGLLQARTANQSPLSLSDTAHVSILQNIIEHNKVSAAHIGRFERQHKSVGGNALRAAVLGGNDGLVSNFSLAMGIAGATNGQQEVLLAGLAGLLAGALSMALGERISVRSSKELYENQMQIEMDELIADPEGEEKELALIYQSKGISESQSQQMAKVTIQNKDHAHQILVKEELGINPEDLQGSEMEAAITSFFLFSIGAIIPVIPFFFIGGTPAIIVSTLLSAIGLFVIGAAITLFTGKNVRYSGTRQVLFGLAAAAITFGIGKLIGVAI